MLESAGKLKEDFDAKNMYDIIKRWKKNHHLLRVKMKLDEDNSK